MFNNQKIRAIYSGGVLRPFKKLSLEEGEKKKNRNQGKKVQKNISLRGLWKGSKISEKDIDKAKHSWEKGVEDQIRFLEED